VHRCNSECWTISLTRTLLFNIKTTWYLQTLSLHQVLHTPSCIWHFEQQKYVKHFPNCPCCCLHVPCHVTSDTNMKILLAFLPLKHNTQFFTSIPTQTLHNVKCTPISDHLKCVFVGGGRVYT
jgi:hypothetical protein